MMDITHATSPAPGATNQDFVVAGPSWVAIFDGATPRAEVDSGCIHTVTWLVSELAAWLSLDLMHEPGWPLDLALKGAIECVRGLHPKCDLDNPDSPSATVAIARQRGSKLDYLVLGDSPIVLDTKDGIRVITDERSAHLPSYTTDAIREHRNQPHGFWVASTKPKAALQAITGSVDISELNQVALLTDGATRYVERLDLGDWRDLLKTLETQGPTPLFEQIRKAETEILPPISQEPNGRMVKRHDDATAVLIKSFQPMPLIHSTELFLRKEYLGTVSIDIPEVDAYGDPFDNADRHRMNKRAARRHEEMEEVE